MNKKALLLLMAAVLLVLGTFTLVWLLTRHGSPVANAPGNGETLQLTGTDSKPVITKNFFKVSPQYDRSVVLYSDSDYDEEYDAESKTFQITFTGATLEAINRMRIPAENRLLEILGVHQEDACRLSITELIPNNEIFALSRNSFPMSFCSGGDSFPQ
jgi:hypothetical protein